jgi:hypothetical protein
MPASCRVCAHKSRKLIDEQLAAGMPFRAIGNEHNLSKDTVARHGRAHLAISDSGATRRAKDAARKRSARRRAALNLVEVAIETPADVRLQLRSLFGVALGALHAAQTSRDVKMTLAALSRAESLLTRLGHVVDVGHAGAEANAAIEDKLLEDMLAGGVAHA